MPTFLRRRSVLVLASVLVLSLAFHVAALAFPGRASTNVFPWPWVSLSPGMIDSHNGLESPADASKPNLCETTVAGAGAAPALFAGTDPHWVRTNGSADPNSPFTEAQGQILPDRAGPGDQIYRSDLPSTDPNMTHNHNMGPWVTYEDTAFDHYSLDINAYVTLDSAYRNLLGTGNFDSLDPAEYGILEIEWERGGVPLYAFPSPGDRITVWGTHIFDCGHPDGAGYRTEIHPPVGWVLFRDTASSGDHNNLPSAAGAPANKESQAPWVWYENTGQAGGDRPGIGATLPDTGLVNTPVQSTVADAFFSSFGGNVSPNLNGCKDNGIFTLAALAPAFDAPCSSPSTAISGSEDWMQPLLNQDYSFFVPAPPKPSPDLTADDLVYATQDHPCDAMASPGNPDGDDVDRLVEANDGGANIGAPRCIPDGAVDIVAATEAGRDGFRVTVKAKTCQTANPADPLPSGCGASIQYPPNGYVVFAKTFKVAWDFVPPEIKRVRDYRVTFKTLNVFNNGDVMCVEDGEWGMQVRVNEKWVYPVTGTGTDPLWANGAVADNRCNSTAGPRPYPLGVVMDVSLVPDQPLEVWERTTEFDTAPLSLTNDVLPNIDSYPTPPTTSGASINASPGVTDSSINGAHTIDYTVKDTTKASPAPGTLITSNAGMPGGASGPGASSAYKYDVVARTAGTPSSGLLPFTSPNAAQLEYRYWPVGGKKPHGSWQYSRTAPLAADLTTAGSGDFNIEYAPISADGIVGERHTVTATVVNNAKAFSTLGIGPGINDWGEVAYMGGTNNGGTGLYLADATGNSRAVNPNWSTNPSRRFGDFVEVNNGDAIAASDRVSGAPPSYRIRIWDGRPGVIDTYQTADASGNGSTAAATVTFDPGFPGVPAAGIAGMMTARPAGFDLTPGSSTPGRGFDSVIVPTMNDNGIVAWLGLTGNTWQYANSDGGTSSDSWTGLIRQVLTDDGHIVARAGGDSFDPGQPPGTATAPLMMWDTSFGSEETIACASGCAHGGFTYIGRFSGASDDSAVIAFTATGPQGTGIYASVRAITAGTGADGRVIVPVAMTSGTTFSKVEGSYRVAVNSTQKSGERAVEIAFMADDASGAKGIWVSRLHFVGQADGTYDSEQPTALRADPARSVVQIGESFAGLAGTVGDIGYYDPLNNRSVGDLAFWISMSTGEQAIVRARPVCPRADYAPGTETSSEYINQYDAGQRLHLPLRYGVRGGNACGPAVYAMAVNNIQHARGTATPAKMADLVAIYGDGTTDATGNPTGVMRRDDGQNIPILDNVHASFDRSRAEAILASKGWTYQETQGKAELDAALDAGMQVLQSTTFGAAPQAYTNTGGMQGNFGIGNVILFSGRTPNEDYIVQDAAGDWFSDPTHPAHYGAGKCGNYTVYAKSTVETNLAYQGSGISAVGRYGLAIGYHQAADPDVLLVQAFPNGPTDGRSFNMWVTDSSGRKAGFPSGDASPVSAIPNSSVTIDPILVSSPDAGPDQDIPPSTFPYAVLVVNPPANLEVHVAATSSDASYRLEYTHFDGGVQTSSDQVTGTIAAGATTTQRITHAPVATAQDVKVVQDTAKTISLAATDKDNDPVTFALASQPSHGALSAVDAAGKVVYTPVSGYLGSDSFTFTANDGSAVSKPATIGITVKTNDPPTVAITPPATAQEGVGLAVSAAGTDPDQESLTYAWTATGGQVSATSDGSTALFTSAEGPSDATVTVIATDPHGATATATAIVHVDNVAPSGAFAAGTANEGSPFTLSVSGATDPSPGDTAAGFSYAFDCGSGYGAFGAGASTSCATTDNGAVSVGGKLRDRDTGAREYRTSVSVKNLPPLVSAGASQTQFWGLPVTLVGSAADPSSVDQAAGFAWGWSFGDGQSASGASAVHAFAKPGSYPAKFSATDKDGATGSAIATITIGKRGGTLAYVGATSAPYGFVTLQARLSDSVDTSSAQLAGHSVLFMLGTQSLVAATDATGVATMSSSSVAPGSYSLAVSLVNDAYYNAAAVRATVTVMRSLGKATGTTLAFATGGTGSLSVTSTATGVTGTLSYSSSSLTVNATQLGPLGIRADGHAAWLNGVDSAGRKLVVYVEDNGPGSGDVFKLSVNGTAVNGAGALTSGDVGITPG
jgi:hypothetical protein